MTAFEGKTAAFLARFSETLCANPPEWLSVDQLPESIDQTTNQSNNQSFVQSIQHAIDALPASKIRSKLVNQIDQCAQVILDHLKSQQSAKQSNNQSKPESKKRKHESIAQSAKQPSAKQSVKQAAKQSLIQSIDLLSRDSATVVKTFRTLYQSITTRAHPQSHSQQSLILTKIRHLFLVDRSVECLIECLMITHSSPAAFPIAMRQQVIELLTRQSTKQPSNQSVSPLCYAVALASASLFISRCAQSASQSLSIPLEIARLRTAFSHLARFPCVGAHPEIELSFLLELLNQSNGQSLSEQQLVEVVNAMKEDLVQAFLHGSAAHFDRHISFLTLRLVLLKAKGPVRSALKSVASRLAATASFPAELIEGHENGTAWLMRGVDAKAIKQQPMIEELIEQLDAVRALHNQYEDQDDDDQVQRNCDVEMSDSEQEEVSSSLHIEINTLIDQSKHSNNESNESNESNADDGPQDMEAVVMDRADSLGPDVSSPPRERQSLRVDVSNNHTDSGEPTTPSSGSYLSAPRDRSRSRSRSRSPIRLLRSNTSPKRTRAGTTFGDILS